MIGPSQLREQSHDQNQTTEERGARLHSASQDA